MTDAIMKAAHALGDLIKNDPVTTALDHAMEDYERSDELMKLIGEYNAQQELMQTAADNAELRESVTERIGNLYNEITTHPVYEAYMTAKEAFDTLYSETIEELQFGITGERPCAHDCSSCGGCH